MKFEGGPDDDEPEEESEVEVDDEIIPTKKKVKNMTLLVHPINQLLCYPVPKRVIDGFVNHVCLPF